MFQQLLALLGLVLLAGGVAAADEDALFQQFRSRYLRIDGKCLELPKFDLRFPNSAKLTKEEALKLAKGAVGGELFAADRQMKALPSVSVGEFGEIDRFRVRQILGDDDLIIEEIPYAVAALDRDARIRVKGMPTKEMVDGKVYNKTVSIAIIGTWKDGASTIFLAIPVAIIREGVSKEAFALLLKDKAVRTKLEKEFAEEAERETKKKQEAEQKAKEKAAAEAKAQEAAKVEAAEQYERAATAKLKFVKNCLADGNNALAKRKLEELIKDYPKASVIEEAKAMLKKLQ